MKTRIHTVLTMLLLAGATAPAAPLTVAVYDFTSSDRNTVNTAATVTTLVTADLTTETNLVMLERAELKKALSEQAFGVSGMVSSEAAAKIGQITGAKVLVTGQVIKSKGNHLVIVASIIGTETGRLFADKAEGAADNLEDLTSDLSRRIAQTISDQATNLVFTAAESEADRIEQLVNHLPGTNRPSISVNIYQPGGKSHSATAEGEFGAILLRAGFTVVDANSDRKPDLEITGVVDLSNGPRHGNLVSSSAVIELKIQARQTGSIIAFDRQESTATDVGLAIAKRRAQVNAVDELAERALPLLIK